MDVHFSEQFLFFTLSFLCGILLSGLYDILRIARTARGAGFSSSAPPETVFGRFPLFRYYTEKRRKHDGGIRRIGEPILVFIEDVLYSLLASLLITLLVYAGNRGIPRLYSAVGMIIGFVLWRVSVGRLLMLLAEYICFFVGAVLFYIFLPFSFLISKIKKVIYKVKEIVYNRLNVIRQRRRSFRKEKKLPRRQADAVGRQSDGDGYEAEFQCDD